jgi:hypothetical protein
MISSCTGLTKFIAVSAIAAMRIRARKLNRSVYRKEIEMRFTTSPSALLCEPYTIFLEEHHRRKGPPLPSAASQTASTEKCHPYRSG